VAFERIKRHVVCIDCHLCVGALRALQTPQFIDVYRRPNSSTQSCMAHNSRHIPLSFCSRNNPCCTPSLQAPGWLAALLDLICAHPPARQPGLQLLTLVAGSSRHWRALLQDAAVLQLPVGLGGSAVAEQPGLRQQVLQLFQALGEQAATSRTAPPSFELCTDEELMGQRICMACQGPGGSIAAALPELLLAMLATENTPAVRRVLLEAGVLGYILARVQQDYARWEASSGPAVKLFNLLLSSELEAGGKDPSEAAVTMGRRAVEGGAFSTWLQHLQSTMLPAAAVVQEAVALVMTAYPAHVTEASDREGLLPVLLWLLCHALVGAATGEGAELGPEGTWLQDCQLPRQQQLLARTVRTPVSRIHSICVLLVSIQWLRCCALDEPMTIHKWHTVQHVKASAAGVRGQDIRGTFYYHQHVAAIRVLSQPPPSALD
jgi:hypothetical protein